MTPTKELKLQLLAALAQCVDAPLLEAGFSRRKGSTTYARALGESQQSIAFVMDVHPRYQPGADAHIHPMLQLSMPRVSEVALSLVNGDMMLLANAPEVIVNQPIEMTAPKSEHQRWFSTGEPQMLQACAQILQFLQRWTLPFLDQVCSAADLTRVYETGDERMLRQRYWYVFVIAAYHLLGRDAEAAAAAQAEFGATATRQRYAALFDSLRVK